jgi:hypothetical protein
MTSMNSYYELAVKDVAGIDKRSGSLFGSLIKFIVVSCYNDGAPPPEGTQIGPVFRAQEKLATLEKKVLMEKNSTYRVVKALLTQCVAYQIPLIDEKGNVRGKSELEAEVKAMKGDKTDLEKFRHAIDLATKLNDKLIASERLVAIDLVNILHESMKVVLKLAA